MIASRLFRGNFFFLGALLLLGIFSTVFAQATTMTMWGGDTIETAGTLDKSLLGQSVFLQNDLLVGKKIYVKLPDLLPGQGLLIESNSGAGYVKVDEQNIVTRFTNGGSRFDSIASDQDGNEYCSLDGGGETGKKKTCRIVGFSSDSQVHSIYFEIIANDSFGISISKVDLSFKFTILEQYDSATSEAGKPADSDVPNKIQNALQIEPGEYTGFVSGHDMEDYYKVVGLSKGAKLKVTASTEVPEGGTNSADISVTFFDEHRSEIAKFYVRKDEIKDKTITIESVESSGDQLPTKAVRYIGVKYDGLAYNTANASYTLSIEATGYKVAKAGSGSSVNCAGMVDVSASDQRCAAVTLVKGKGIILGTKEGKFEGNRVLNRAELGAVILRFMGKEAESSDDVGDLDKFSDVAKGDHGKWWVGVLKKALREGVIKGFGDNTVRPADPVLKSQFVVIFARAKNITLPHATEAPAKDVSVSASASAWYRDAVKYVLDEQLMVSTHGYFYPNAGITRFQVADLLARWYAKNP